MLMQSFKNINLQDAKRELALQNAFNSGNLRARWEYNGTMIGTYTVYSYNTPIAKLDPNRSVWFTPIRYSVTTSKHLNMVKRAWGLL
jgi:hypothetical protein